MARSKALCLTAAALAASGTSAGVLAVTAQPAGAASSTLASGATLTGGQELANGSYVLVMQTDGNLVEYNGGSVVWQTYTPNESGNYLVMQTDGNLVLYGPGSAVRWQSGTYGYSGASLTLQADSNVVVYYKSSAIWAESWTQSVAGEQAYAPELFARYGWSSNQLSPLIDLWNHESGWSWSAYNPQTCSGGGHAYGVPQSCPGNKMAAYGSDWQTDALTQIQWGENYIKSVWGSPQAADNHEIACNYVCGYGSAGHPPRT